MRQRSAGPELATDSAALSPVGLRHRWLLLPIRAAWVVLAVVVLGLDIAGAPYAYDREKTVCTLGAEVCREEGLLTSEGAEELRELGLSPEFHAAYMGVGLQSVVTLAFFVVAAVIFLRRPDDRMALFASFMLLAFGGAAAAGTMHQLPDVHPAFWFPVSLLDYLGQVSFGVFFYLFPDGRFAPRWTRLLAAAWALFYAVDIFFLGSSSTAATNLLFLVLVGSLVFVQIYRYRRVSTPPQRQQTKWVVFGFTVALTGFVGVLAPYTFVMTPPRPGSLEEMAAVTLIYAFLLLIPLSIGIAVLRHRLFDIDILINRTLVYGALTACVVGIYVFVVGYLGALFQTGGNLAISLAATALVAVLFAPLRERLQKLVNRLMYGERDDPYGVLSRLGQRLEATLAPEAALSTVVETVARSLKLPYAAILLPKQDGGLATAAEYGTPADETIALPLTHRREPMGEMVLSPRSPGEAFSSTDLKLLEDLARQAGAAVHAVRLTDDLQRSRERLVTAREEERRRLRRDLHDGLGTQLAAQTLKIGSARLLCPRDPAGADALMAEMETDVEKAISDIRRVVYDLRPPDLDELGLAGAVRESAAAVSRTKGPRVSVEAPEELPDLPAAVEVAAYRIVREAMTNVVRHAGAESCRVRLSLADELEVEVTDDGIGVPEKHKAGVGLSSMKERAAELGGTCVVEPAPGGGARVSARLPLPKEDDHER